jgi:uncharacterized protein YbjT (DUF2867 family)
MRDVEKPIPGITLELEETYGFRRIQADLSDPQSIEKAVSQSQATVAFTYIVASQQDGMRATFAAMKRAGISHLVLLSSFLVYPDTKTALTGNFIGAIHAKVEIALVESGLRHTIVRPMYFNSNLWREKEGIKKGEISLLHPDAVNDYIAPEDIGSVCGARLMAGDRENDEVLPLCGPKLTSQREAWGIVAQELGCSIRIKEIDVDQFLAIHRKIMPATSAQALADAQINVAKDPSNRYPEPLYKEASDNIFKYTGREPIQLSEWVRSHKGDILDG